MGNSHSLSVSSPLLFHTLIPFTAASSSLQQCSRAAAAMALVVQSGGSETRERERDKRRREYFSCVNGQMERSMRGMLLVIVFGVRRTSEKRHTSE